MARAGWHHAQRTVPLDLDWECAVIATGGTLKPSELATQGLDWVPALVPGTLASAMRAAGKFAYGQDNFDAMDCWFRCTHSLATAFEQATSLILHLEGLATLADVYWNDALLLSCDNMFLSHRIDVSAQDHTGHLHIHFKSVQAALGARRPRPRWKTRLVDNQQLRWIRTTLLGRIPAWSPPVAPVGPFRSIALEMNSQVQVLNTDLRTQLSDDFSVGQVHLKLDLMITPGTHIASIALCIGASTTQLRLSQVEQGGHCFAEGVLTLPSPQLWWPHTHGEPYRYPAEARISMVHRAHQDNAEQDTQVLDFGMLGFRKLHIDQTDGAFTVHLNGVATFCRGACWTPVDMVSLCGSEADLRPTLTLARDAGMNMLRVGGTMIYESDAFYALCDELGILVWQDFMFANMDYPVEDKAFAVSIKAEAHQFLNRIQSSACVAVLCGNSEIEQQSAMLGLTHTSWSNCFFSKVLPALCAQIKPDALYWPSSPSGGVLPFQVDSGIAHYYGVGAYLRPLEDARRSGVRFTTECLGFSHIPDESTVDALLEHGGQPFHHPVWKQRVPRDGGAGWDFEDVRDHYMAQLFRVDPMRLRYADMPRYLALARVTTGEVIAQTVSEWRRAASPCQGALVWWLRDLWLGAGWGLIDASGKPKAAYWYAKRAMQPLTVLLSDEGLNGLEIQLLNEQPVDFSGELEFALYRHGEVRVAHTHRAVTVPAHGGLTLRADALFDHFLDTAYAYRFGPAGHHLAAVTLRHSEHIVAQSFHHPVGLPSVIERDLGLQAALEPLPDGAWQLVLKSQKFAQSVYVDVPGFLPDDNYFHIEPGVEKKVLLKRQFSVSKVQGRVSALNAELSLKITPPLATAF